MLTQVTAPAQERPSVGAEVGVEVSPLDGMASGESAAANELSSGQFSAAHVYVQRPQSPSFTAWKR
jgi:hypothetical protein